MGSFGLGLILSFTDNASAGMRSATQTFQQMSSTADAVSSSMGNSMANMVTACYALDSVGTTLVGIGSSVVGTFLNISQEVIDTGMTMMGFRMQLQALYGENGFENKMKQIQDYARDSVFEVEGLMQAVVTMKAVGIEAMDAVTSSSGQTTQTLMDYASDIAAMFPNMRNAYGTGVNAAMGALKEYIAEGNAMSLKRGAGLDITGILGEDKGASIEERTRQVADLVEVLGIAGYTTSLLGTPTQQLSKMQDVLFNTMSDIADSGVFDKYTALLTKLADWLTNLSMDTDKYSAVVSILGDTLTSILVPLDSILDSLISKADALLDWAVANPTLARNILLTVAAVGAFLVVGGLFLKLVSSIGMASAGFNFLKTLPSLLGTVGSSFVKLTFKALPFLALAGLAYYAWSNNLFGIRDLLEEAGKYVSGFFTVIKDAWGDNELSQENYDLANSLGILPLIESLLMLKYYWGYFVEGFKTGFNDFFESLQDTLGVFGIDIGGIFESVGNFLRDLFDIGQEDKWTDIGEKAGKIAGIAVSLLAVFKVLSLFKPLMGLFKGGIPFLGGGKSGTTVASPTATLKNFGNLAIMLVGLAGVVAVIGLVSKIDFSIARVLQIVVVIGALGLVGTALSAFAGIAGKIKFTSVAKGLANMAIVLLGLTVVFAVIAQVSMMNFDSARVMGVVAAVVVLGVLGTALSVLAGIIGLIPVSTVASGLANMAIVLVGLSAVAAVISFLAGYVDPGQILMVVSIITVLGVVGTALTALAGLIGLIPIPVILAGIANISLVIGALTGLAVLVSSALPTIGDNMTSFITSLEPAFQAFQMLQGLDMAGIGDFFTSFGEFMLLMSGDKFLSFFSGGSDLAGAAQQLVDFATTAQEAFNIFAQMSPSATENILAFMDVAQQLGSMDFSSIGSNMINTINTSISQSSTLLNTFASSGSSVGASLMNSIASGISAQAGVVRSALSSALSGISVTASPSVTLNLKPTVNTAGMIGLSTGGYVKETGVAVLHPNEVVVNDDTTRKLNEFLNQQNMGSTSNPSYSSNKGETHNDYSVTFAQGSVVIQLSNSSDSELERAADKLMKIIERKQQLKAMASRA